MLVRFGVAIHVCVCVCYVHVCLLCARVFVCVYNYTLVSITRVSVKTFMGQAKQLKKKPKSEEET